MSKQLSLGSHTKTDGKSLTYHSTTVFSVYRNIVTLNSGGWQTVTTKKKMNLAAQIFDAPIHVYQEKNIWYVALQNDFDNPILFEDGMKIDIN